MLLRMPRSSMKVCPGYAVLGIIWSYRGNKIRGESDHAGFGVRVPNPLTDLGVVLEIITVRFPFGHQGAGPTVR